MAGKKRKSKKMADGGAIMEAVGNIAGDANINFTSDLKGKDLRGILAELEATNKKQGAADIIQGTIEGAGKGSSAGLLGTAIGAITGLGKSIFERVSGNKERDIQREGLITKANQGVAGIVSGAKSRFGYKDGGKVKKKDKATDYDKIKKFWNSASLEDLQTIANPKKFAEVTKILNPDVYGKTMPNSEYSIRGGGMKRFIAELAGSVPGINIPAVEGCKGSMGKQASPDFKRAIDDLIKEKSVSVVGLKDGGKIKGKGTAKSDSIKTKMPAGSFVVPEANADIAMEIGTSVLGWTKDEKMTKRKDGKTVDVSNGEVMFTPTEVKALTSIGINLNELAPNAEPGNKLADGGGVFDDINKASDRRTKRGIHGAFDAINLESDERTKEGLKGPLDDHVANALTGIDAQVQNETFAKVDKVKVPGEDGLDLNSIIGASGAALGAGQIIAGAVELGNTPEAIMPTVSDDLNKLVAETTAEAQYGLEPSEVAKAKRSIQRNTNQALEKVKSEFAGGPGSTYNRISDILNKGNEAISNFTVIDDQVMREKRKEARGYKFARGQRKDYIGEFAFKDSRDNQGLLADVVDAGVSNVIGAAQFHQYLEAKKQRDKYGNSLTNSIG